MRFSRMGHSRRTKGCLATKAHFGPILIVQNVPTPLQTQALATPNNGMGSRKKIGQLKPKVSA